MLKFQEVKEKNVQVSEIKTRKEAEGHINFLGWPPNTCGQLSSELI